MSRCVSVQAGHQNAVDYFDVFASQMRSVELKTHQIHFRPPPEELMTLPQTSESDGEGDAPIPLPLDAEVEVSQNSIIDLWSPYNSNINSLFLIFSFY